MFRLNPLLSLLLGASLLAACSDDTGPGPDRQQPGTDMLVVGEGGASCSTAAWLPASNQVGDYTQKAAPELARNASELQALINGGSEKYAQNKFVCLALVVMTSSSKTTDIDVWAFDQTDAAGATAAMDAVTGTVFTELTPTIGDASKQNQALVAGYEAIARKGKVLVRVFTRTATSKDDAVALLKAVLDAAP